MASSPPLSRNPDRTRRRLLQAAIRLFSDSGFHAISVDQIVSAARVNKRMVYHYFGSKEKLYQAALHAVYNRLEDVEFHAVGAGLSPQEQLADLLKGYFAFLEKNPDFTQLLQWENLEKGRHILKGGHVLSKNPFLERFRQIVEEGMRLGEFRRNLNTAHLLIHFIGLCSIYHSNRFSLSQGLKMDLGDPRERNEGMRQALALVFDGIRARRGTPRS